MHLTGRAVTGVVLALLGSGCSATVSAHDPARTVAVAFYTAVGQGDGLAACALLAPDAVASLEQAAGKSCGEALPEEDLPAGQVRRVQVYGGGAFVELDHDTAFLGRFPDGWRITAAGCQERPGRPYDCRVEVD